MEAVDLEHADGAGDAERYNIDAEHHAVLEDTLAGDGEELAVLGQFINPRRA